MLSDYYKFFIDKDIHLIIIYIILGLIVYQIIKKVIISKTNKLKKKRQQTMQKLIQNIIKYAIIILVTATILNIVGVNVTSIVAGLGIASIVLSLALKDMLEDVFSGVSIVFEDQFDIGDYVEINGFEGTVIDIGLKSTKIKNIENTVKILANRTIIEVINYSKDFPNFIVDVPIPYEITNKKADKVVENIIKRIQKELPNQEEGPKLLGINKFNSSNIDYRLQVSVKINEQFSAKRQVNRIIKEEFDKEKISIPYEIIEVKNG